MNWKNAFHPHNHISSCQIDRVVASLEMQGCKVGQDRMNRIETLSDHSGKDLLQGFFAPLDDPARVLPRVLVQDLDFEFPPQEQLAEQEGMLFA